MKMKHTLVTTVIGLSLFSLTTSTVLLPTTTRQIDARDFTGTFSSLISRTNACPVKVKHSGLIEGGNAVAHGNIEIDGVPCNNNGNMNLIPVSQTNRVNQVLNNLQPPTKGIAQTLYNNAVKVNGSYIGSSGAARVCGNRTLAANTFFIFVKSDAPFDTGVTGIVPLDANMRIMVYVEPGKSYICPFDAKLRESPSPQVAPTAAAPGVTISPQPSTAANVTSGNATEPTPTVSATPSTGPVTDAGGEPEEPTATPVVGTAGGGRPICFPGSATVELSDGSIKAMKEVELGDLVRVAGNKYSPVFMFTHKLSSVEYNFYKLTTESGHSITLTSGHYLKVNNAMRPASSVNMGDSLTLGDGTHSKVVAVSQSASSGLFNPQTIEGSIIVDGVVASTYTTTVEIKTAHSLLAPLRTLYNVLGVSMRSLEKGADNLAKFVPSGAVVY